MVPLSSLTTSSTNCRTVRSPPIRTRTHNPNCHPPQSSAVPHTLNRNFNCSHSRLMRSISPSCVEASRVVQVLVQVRMLLLRVPAFILRNLEVPVPTWYLSQAFLRFHAVSALFAGKLERNINLQTTVTKTPEHQNTTDTTLKQP